jgi:16S rRNA (cytosine967-C5)-methyltransferase
MGSEPRRAEPGAAARATAARILAEVLAGRATLPEALARHRPEPEDSSFVRELAWGTARHGLRLDHLVRSRLKRPPRSRDLDVHALLMIGAYQLGWTQVPAHASVHATVAACDVLGKGWARGLVNAVLRALARTDPNADGPSLPEPARLDHPAWLLEALRARWPGHWPEVVAAGNARPPLTLRVHGDRDAMAATLAEAGFPTRPGRVAATALQLETPAEVTRLPGFAEGRLSVQDEGAQLAAELLGARPGERVLDACAAPGGKTLHLAQRTPGLALLALDSDPRRCARIEENLARGGVRAEVRAADATRPEDWWDGVPFDRILVDAPCTATGILRRQPDVRLLRRQDDVAKLARTQRALLEALWPLLAPGGTLLYCTCSVLPEEGEGVVQPFLEAHRDAVAETIDVGAGEPRGPGLQLAPTADAHDGFYYARLRRAPDATKAP